MSTASSLIRGSIFRTLELAVVVGAAFFVTPALVHALGERVYGFWTLVAAFVGYYGLLDMGLTQAAARYLSQALGKEDEAELARVAATAFSLFTALGAGVIGLTALCCALTPLFVKGPGEAAMLRELLLVLGVAAAVGFPTKVCTGLLQASIRYDVIAVISIVRSIACNGAIYYAARAGRGVLTVAAVTFVVSMLQYAATYGACKACFPRLRISSALAERARVGLMLRHGWDTVVCQLGDVMRFRLDTVLVASFLGAALVTPYSVGVRIVEAFVQLVLGVIGMMLPVFSRYEGRGDHEAIREALLQATKLGTILSTFVGLSVVFYGRAFIERWMGPGFVGAYGVAAILAASFMIDLPESPGVQLLYGLSKHRVYAVLGIVEGVANVGFSILLLRRFGLYGVALGTLAEFLIFKTFIQPVYICRPIGLSVRAYMVDTILWTFAKTTALLGVFFVGASRFLAPSYGSIAACAAAQTVLFVPAAYVFLLGPKERKTVGAALEGLRPRRPGRAETPSIAR